MINEYLPIGQYDYYSKRYNLDEAWEEIKKSYEKEESIICKVTNILKDGETLQIDFHGIKGFIKRGFITQNRYLNNEQLLNKTTRVHVYKLDTENRMFYGTRIKVEENAKKEISSYQIGDEIEGIVTVFANEESCAFLDIKEGISAYLSLSRITRMPNRCCKVSDYINIGERIKGRITFIQSKDNSVRGAVCNISLLDNGRSWEEEISALKVGDIIWGYPKEDTIYSNQYFIEYNRQICVRINTEKELDENQIIKVEIINIATDKKTIYGKLISNENIEQEREENNEKQNKEKIIKEEGEDVLKKDIVKRTKDRMNGSLFSMKIVAQKSPFSVRINESKFFESTPNKKVPMFKIEEKIKTGQINEIHFNILCAINALHYATSKQIRSYLYLYYPSISITQDKLNRRLDSLVKNALADRIKFQSDEGEGIYRVYFLNKNGHLLLQSYLHIRNTSYISGLVAKPIEDIKRQLATNQIILAYKEKMDFIQAFRIGRVLKVEENSPIRPSAILEGVNSFILLETSRRYSGWQERLHEKMYRYQKLFQKHERQEIMDFERAVEFLQKHLYIVLVCEDFEHARQIRELLFGHEMYSKLLFTYDLLVFQKGVSNSVFQFKNNDDVVYYDSIQLFHNNLLQEIDNNYKEDEKREDKIEQFYQFLAQSFQSGLKYLQKNNSEEVLELVNTKCKYLFEVLEDENYMAVLPEAEQYYAYLLFLIEHNLIRNDSAKFHGMELKSEKESENVLKQEKIITIQRNDSKPADLEEAVKLISEKIEKWMCKKYGGNGNIDSPLTITKHSERQTSGVQNGYDVGLDFMYQTEEYHLGFECKNYQTLQIKSENNTPTSLSISRYAYNLIEFYMSCTQGGNAHNHWILICPFGDLQNDFEEKLFRKWNREIPFLQIHVFSQKQTSITCEELLALDEEAYKKIYGIAPPEQSEEEKDALIEKIFFSIVRKNPKEKAILRQIHQYPFYSSYDIRQQLMTVRTIEGEDALEQIFIKLNKQADSGIFVIGEYGSGKTYLTYKLVRRILENPEQYLFYPLWFKLANGNINLNDGNVDAEADKFIETEIKNYENMPSDFYFGENKTLLIILDGFDEIISGLSETGRKIKFLQKLCEKFKSKYPYNKKSFLITSRENDFAACKKNNDFCAFFEKYDKIILGDCEKEDAKKEILNLKQINLGEDKNQNLLKISENERLLAIVRKPLYFGFLRELIIQKNYTEYEHEIDIIEAIILQSVQKYSKKESEVEKIKGMLRINAIEISKQLANGGSDSIKVLKHYYSEGMEQNVIQLKVLDSNYYLLRFYHNAIREYLVAESMFLEIEKYVSDARDLINSELYQWLEKVDMTPEMMKFLCAFVERDEKKRPDMKQFVVKILCEILKTANEKSKEKLGTHVLALLLYIKPELEKCDLSGIYAGNLYLWNCTLREVNFQNAYLTNCTMFNVKLEHVDFRNANLRGLVLNSEDKIKHVSHFEKSNQLIITVFYASGQLIDYCFDDKDNIKQFVIEKRGTVKEKEYGKHHVISDNVLIYSENCIKTLSENRIVYTMKPENKLVYLDERYAIVSINGTYNIVLHNKKYQSRSIKGILKMECNTICVLEQNIYLSIKEQQLILYKNEECVRIMDLNSSFECFFARKQEDIIKIYIKYREGIQVVQYKEQKMETSFYNLDYSIKYHKIVAVTENLLYGIAEDIVYLFDLKNLRNAPIELQTKVVCSKLILEDEDGSNRVEGQAEYEQLKREENIG